MTNIIKKENIWEREGEQGDGEDTKVSGKKAARFTRSDYISKRNLDSINAQYFKRSPNWSRKYTGTGKQKQT